MTRIPVRAASALLFAVLVARTPAFAQIDDSLAVHGGLARMLALGGSPLNLFLDDRTLISVNPAFAVDHSGIAFVETGWGGGGTGFGGTHQHAGALVDVEGWTVGITFGRREGPMFAELSQGVASGGPFTGVDFMKSALDQYLQGLFILASNEPRAPLEVTVASRWDELRAGVSLYRSSWSRKDEGTGSVSSGKTSSVSNSQTGIKAGVAGALASGIVLDGVLLARLNWSTSEYTSITGSPSTSSFDATGTEISVTARVHWRTPLALQLVGVLRAEYFGYTPDVLYVPAPPDPVANPNDFTKQEWECAVGAVVRSARTLVSAGLGVQYIRLRNDASAAGNQVTHYTRSWFDLPKVTLGAEFSLSDHFVGRAGYTRRFSEIITRTEAPGLPPIQTTVSTETGYLPTYGLTAADQQMSLGLGIHWNAFTLDAYLAEQVLRSGPWLLSGIQQAVFGIVSLSCRL